MTSYNKLLFAGGFLRLVQIWPVLISSNMNFSSTNKPMGRSRRTTSTGPSDWTVGWLCKSARKNAGKMLRSSCTCQISISFNCFGETEVGWVHWQWVWSKGVMYIKRISYPGSFFLHSTWAYYVYMHIHMHMHLHTYTHTHTHTHAHTHIHIHIYIHI